MRKYIFIPPKKHNNKITYKYTYMAQQIISPKIL